MAGGQGRVGRPAAHVGGPQQRPQTVVEFHPLPVDTAVTDEWARLRLLLATAGRRVNVNDTWIAATAPAHGVPVVIQDADYETLAEISDLRIITV